MSIELLQLLGIDQKVKKRIQGHTAISGVPGFPVQAHTALKSMVWGVWVCVLCHIQLFVTPWTVAHQAPLSVRFSRQEYCSGLPLSSPGDPTNPGIEPKSPVSPTSRLNSLPLSYLGSPKSTVLKHNSMPPLLPSSPLPSLPPFCS